MKLTPLAIALLLAGCASVTPMQHAPTAPASPEIAQQKEESRMSEQWDKPPVLVEGKSSVVLLTPQSVPESVRNRKISLELEPGATVNDLVAVLGKLGVSIILADQDAAKKEFFLPHFKGTVGTLLSTVTRVTDVWFTWHDGSIVVGSFEKIGVSVPQEANFADQLTKGLDGLGVKEKSVSWQAGMAVLEVTPGQFRKVKQFLERYTANAAVVTLQLAVVNVSMKQDVKQGIDWEKLQISALGSGTRTALNDWNKFITEGANARGTTTTAPRPTTPTTPTTGTGTTGGTTTPAPAPAPAPTAEPTTKVTALGLAGGALSGAVFGGRFSFDGLFNFLQTYGSAETQQSVILKTVAGNKVELKSLTQIPYISEIVSTTTTGSSTSNTSGSSKTAKADDGITVEMTPTYDASSNSVTIDFKLSLKAVVAFNEMSAGNNLGTITQPTTAERSFTDTLRLRPGETVVVGGLSYDSVNNNKGAPVFLKNTNLESQTLKVDRQSTFIVLRPTIMKLGQVMDKETGEDAGGLDLLPAGTEPVVTDKVLKRSNSKEAKK